MIAIPAIMALAQLAPSVIGLLTRDKTAAKAAETVSQVAQAITGTSTDDAALEALQNNPAKVIEYKNAMNEHVATMYELETKRVELVNNTMHLEAANSHGFVRNVRPLFGYTVIYCMFMMFNTVMYTLLRYGPDDAIEMIKAYSQMEWMFLAMLSAMGVYITSRTKDKNPGALGMIGALAKRIGK